MKTVFNRALSLVMCLILVCSTMSVMAFGANAADDFDYKAYAQNVTKENVHHLLDLADETLADANGADNKLRKEIKLLEDIPNFVMAFVNGVIERFIDKSAIRLVSDGGFIGGDTDLYLSLDLSSVDAICKTLDNYRGVIELATDDTISKMLDLGDLSDINLSVFAEDLSRAKSGDYKIFSEVLELADANSGIIEKLLSGTLDLGVIGSAVKLDIDVSKMLREGTVDALFKGKPNYNAAKNRALTDFDAFVYTDLVGLVSEEGGILEGITITADTTVDDVITEAFNILVDKYLIDLVKGASFSFATLGEKYEALDTIIKLDGDYSFDGIEFTNEKSVLEQINGVLGKIFAQVVPGFTEWKTDADSKEDYKNIGDNTRKLVKYIAENSGLGIDTNVSDEALMLEILKIVFRAGDTNGEKEIYELIKNTTTLTEMTNKILVHLSGKDYPDGTTYEHVFGDYIIEQLSSTIPLYDEKGNEITVGSGKTVWEVANSALNFFLVDKNIKAYLGKDFKKSQSFFEKLDILLSFTADEGKLKEFESEVFFKELFDCLFRMDLQGFVEATAVKALTFAGDTSVVTFIYNTVCNVVNNWSVDGGIEKQTSGHFEAAMKNAGLAKIVKAVITTLNRRVDGTASLVGLLAHFITDVSEKVEIKDATCTASGYSTNHKTCLKCNRVYLQGTVIAAKGHRYNAGVVTRAAQCTVKGEKLYTCTVCGHKKTEPIAATGHRESGYRVTKAATYKTMGQTVNKCTVCNTTLGTKNVNTLTLSKPTGLKFTAASTTSIKFTWNKVTGAEAYTLYYKTGSGKWIAVNAGNNTTVTVKKLKKGTTYSFKVVAVAGSNKSADSSTVSATTKPVAVTLKALRSQKKKEIVVEWKKVSGVTGYEVQTSTAKNFKKNAKTTTIKKQKTVKTIVKKLKSKKKYYVRVRAYKTVNKVKVVGAWSKVKTIKCK